MLIQRPLITLCPNAAEFYESRKGKGLTVLSGANNSGKSYLLKQMRRSLETTAMFLGVSRFGEVRELRVQRPDENQLKDFNKNVKDRLNEGNVNDDSGGFDMQSLLRNLTNKQRDEVFRLCGECLGGTMSLKHVDHENDMTPFYIDLDGHSVHFGSSGSRLLITLLGHCFDSRFDTLFLDEPELGLNPKIQSTLGRWFTSETRLKTELPHLKTLIISTHSHLFLDRNVLTNNFVVSKNGNTITTKGVNSIAELNHLQFGLLGNDLESLFMPSAIVLVEGPSDYTFLRKVLGLRFAQHRIAIVNCLNDDGIKKRLHWLSEAFPDLVRSPYHRRTWAVLDSQTDITNADLSKKGIHPENVQQWKNNGIEYVYPSDILKSIFSCNDAELATMKSDGSKITVGTQSMQKVALSEKVSEKIMDSTKYPEELEQFLMQIQSRLSE